MPSPDAGRPAVATTDRLRRAAYLQPGQLIAAPEPLEISTVLGSCVAVCLWDRRRGQGGANHFLLPHHGSGQASPRYGDVAVEQLVAALLALGSRRDDLVAKLFGGANVITAFRGEREQLGARNVAVARHELDRARVPLVAEDVGGKRGRKLIFHTDDGLARVRLI